MPFAKDKITNGGLAFGINFYADKSGDLDFATTLGNLSLAANKWVDKKNNISIGLQGGFGQRGVQAGTSMQEWDSQYETNVGFNSSNPTGESQEIAS